MCLSFLRLMGAVSLLIALFFSSMYGQVAGQIAGKIVDEQTGEPLPGASIMVEGTTWGAATNHEGEFRILNIPPGTYSLNITFVGYESLVVTDVEVFVDRTARVDVELSEGFVELGEITVVARREGIRRDVSQTQTSLRPAEIMSVPVSSSEQLWALQPGFEFQGAYDATVGSPATFRGVGVQVRGGDISDTDMTIDGHSLRDRHVHAPNLRINLSSVQEAQLTTGGFTAEQGGIRSGLINVVTKEGHRDRYNLFLDVQYTPPQQKHFGPSIHDPNNAEWQIFTGEHAMQGITQDMVDHGSYARTWMGWEEFAKDRPHSAEHYMEKWKWQHRPFDYAHQPDHRIEATLSGPLPGGLLNSSAVISYSDIKRWFPFPIGERKHYRDQNVMGRITMRPMDDVRVSVVGQYTSILSNQTHHNQFGRSFYTGDHAYQMPPVTAFQSIYDQGTYIPVDYNHFLVGVTINHLLSSNTYHEFRVSYRASHREALPMRETDHTPIHYIYDSQTGEDIGYSELPHGFWIQFTMDDPGVHNISGRGRWWDDSRYNEWEFGYIITSQIGSYNMMRAGAKIMIPEHDYWRFYGTLPPHVDQDYRYYQHEESPLQMEAFLQNKIEYEGLVANIGVRLDYFDPRTNWFDFSDPFDSQFNPRTWPGDSFYGTLDWRTIDVDPKIYISPRLGVSHPISDQSKVFFNYGHFYQTPDFFYLYRVQVGHDRNSLLFGNPDLEMEKTVTYEAGYEFSFVDLFDVQVSGYYRDNTNQVSQITTESYYADADYISFQNTNYSDVRGLELRLSRAAGPWITGWIAYHYMIYNEGFTGFEFNFEDPIKQRDADYTAEETRPYPRPSFRANINIITPHDFGPEIFGQYILADWRLNFLYRWTSGGRITWNPGNIPGIVNNVPVRAFEITNLTLEKSVSLFDTDMMIYMQVDNVFNRKTLNPDAITFGGNLSNYVESLDIDGGDKYGDYPKPGKEYIQVQWWDWARFINPRIWHLGIRLNI